VCGNRAEASTWRLGHVPVQGEPPDPPPIAVRILMWDVLVGIAIA